MILETLLGDAAIGNFMEEYYLKLPFAHPGGCEHLRALGDWSVLEKLLASPAAEVIVGSGGQYHAGSPPRSHAEARPLLDAGYTIGIRHAERHDPSLAELAGAFLADFGAAVDIHLYCTPPGHRGFSWHYDAEEVFVLQLRGAKEWWLRKNTVNPWPLVESLPADMRYEREIMPAFRCPLAAGDWLYIPAGYWHKTHAGGEESISLSVGLLAPAAIDVFDFVRRQLLDSLRWRQRLPCFGAASHLSAASLEQNLRVLFAELADDLAKTLRDEKLPAAYLKHRNGSENPR